MHWERDRWKKGRKKVVQYLSYKGIQLQNKEFGDSPQAIKIDSETDSKVDRFGIMHQTCYFYCKKVVRVGNIAWWPH